MSDDDCTECERLQGEVDDLKAEIGDLKSELHDTQADHEVELGEEEDKAAALRAIIGRIADSVLDIDTAVAEAVQ